MARRAGCPRPANGTGAKVMYEHIDPTISQAAAIPQGEGQGEGEGEGQGEGEGDV